MGNNAETLLSRIELHLTAAPARMRTNVHFTQSLEDEALIPFSMTSRYFWFAAYEDRARLLRGNAQAVSWS